MVELNRRKRIHNGFTYVTVIFNQRGRQYMFKTILKLKPNMKVLVKTAQGLTFGTVFKTDVKPFDNSVELNWVIAIIQMNEMEISHFNELKRLNIKE